jgi:CheY-like chemotaxis protein
VKTILLVDDDPAVVDLLSAKLRSLYRIVATTDPREAVSLALDRKPDLILCDMDMPGMNGAEVAAGLRAKGAGSIPLAYLTGLVSREEAAELPQGGSAGHRVVAKRASLNELVACIKSLLGE